MKPSPEMVKAEILYRYHERGQGSDFFEVEFLKQGFFWFGAGLGILLTLMLGHMLSPVTVFTIAASCAVVGWVLLIFSRLGK